MNMLSVTNVFSESVIVKLVSIMTLKHVSRGSMFSVCAHRRKHTVTLK